MKRILAGVALAALTLGGTAVAVAAPASAHDKAVQADCSTLTVDLTSYATGDGRSGHRSEHHHDGRTNTGRTNDDRANTVTVTIDGEVVAEDDDFGADYHESFSLTDASSWHVVVTAWDGAGYNLDESGTTEKCGTTPAPAGDDQYQVGIYLYPKLDASYDATWENSGEQVLLATRTLTLTKDQVGDDSYWYTELPDSEALDEAEADLCRGWGIQQDLLVGGTDEYQMPTSITYPDGSSMDGHLKDWQHQELSDFGVALPTAADCDAPPAPPVVEDQVVVPVAPATVDECGADVSDIVLPAATDEVTYLSTANGVLATPTAGHAFGDDLGGYTRTEGGDVLYAVDDILTAAADCGTSEAPSVPSDVATPVSADSVPAAEAPADDATPSPSASPVTTAESAPQLAMTGATVGVSVAIAVLLIGGGVVLFMIRRRAEQG